MIFFICFLRNKVYHEEFCVFLEPFQSNQMRFHNCLQYLSLKKIISLLKYIYLGKPNDKKKQEFVLYDKVCVSNFEQRYLFVNFKQVTLMKS
jgi:hypothetical protein